jgi:pullulanase
MRHFAAQYEHFAARCMFRASRHGAGVFLLILATGLASCGPGPGQHKTKFLPQPQPRGAVAATVDITPPPGNAGRKILAGLKRHGRVVASGQAIVPSSGAVQVIIQAMDASQPVADGECELWLTISRGGLESCYPGYGDWFVEQKWTLQPRARTKVLTDPSIWKKRTLSKPGNLITIHYHRYDEDYDDVSLWTWDAYFKRLPEANEIFEVGRDAYGSILQLDRGDYGLKGDSDKIGLLPRLAGDWNRKDGGGDRFWRTNMGNEVYLIGGQDRVWTQPPDTSPRVVVAYMDAPTRLVVETSRPVKPDEVTTDRFSVNDSQKNRQAPVSTRILFHEKKLTSNEIELTLAGPLDIASGAYEVSLQGFGGSARVFPRGVLDDTNEFYDAQAVLGATYRPEATTFRVFAPMARSVQVLIYDAATGDKGRAPHDLHMAGKGIWEGRVDGDLEGRFYVYKIDDHEREVLDIYCVNAVDSSRRARITDLSKTNPPNWDSAKVGPPLASAVDMVIYEMHVRDFTIAANSGVEHKGKYLGFTQAGARLPEDEAIKTGLDNLAELGITHVQLMPIQDFDNDETSTNYNWGYVTMDYNSPEGWYATNIYDQSRIRELKQLVAALHQRGIGVILDVVYNHTANNAPFNSLVPRYYFRFLPDGSYSNGSGCGNDFRSEAPMGRKYILDTLKYWVQEYGIDGFRFDLMALIDLDTMKDVERELRAIRPGIVLYGEPWGGGGKQAPVRPTNKQTIRGTHIGAFNDNIRNALIGSPFDKNHAGFVQDGSNLDNVRRGIEGSWRDWAPTPAQAINFLSCHDNWVVWDKLKLSKPDASDRELEDMMKLGYLLLFTSQGVPFLQGGEEFARTKFGNGNSFNAPDTVNEVDWSLKKKHYDLFTYARDIITLRKAHPLFRLRSKEQIGAWLKFHDQPNPASLMFTIDPEGGLPDETWRHVCVIANSADELNYDFALPAGPWHVAFDVNGAVTSDRIVEGTVRVRYKSGMILYQR